MRNLLKMKFDFPYFLNGKNTQWMLVSIIVFFSLLIFNNIFSIRLSPLSTMDKTPINDKTVQPFRKNSYTAILNSPLFGIYIPDNIADGGVKKSLLNVTVAGILLSNKTEHSQVIIRSANNEETVYQIGDTIPGDALVKRITANDVIVEHDGNIERLSLPKNGLNFEPAIEPLKVE